MNYKAVLEGLLFVSGDDGLTVDKMCQVLDLSFEEVLDLLKELFIDYNNDDRGIDLVKYGDVYKLVTKKEHVSFYKRLVDSEVSETLSNSALEVLSIIAYNEPISRVMVDEIRGVSSAHIIRKLVFKNLIKDVGRSELPGKPILYGVTDQFLDYFGIESVKELPEIEIDSVVDETELYDSKYKDE